MAEVYETIRVRQGSIPLLARHVERMERNSAAIGLPMPHCLRERIRDACNAQTPDVRLRVLWDGKDLSITTLELPSLDPLRVHTATIPHGGYRIKTTDRVVFDQARAEAHASGADEALLLTKEGFVAEGTLFAVGWFRDGVLCVPSLDLGILPSVGRGRVLEVARELDYPIEEGCYKRAALDGRPVFATTATRGVVRISTLDGVAVPSDERLDGLAAGFWPS